MKLRWPIARSDPAMSVGQWMSYFTFLGQTYGAGVAPTTLYGQKKQEPPDSFIGYVQQLYRWNGVVFACMSVRQLMFAEVRFQFRQIRNGRPGDLFGTSDLEILERPWPNGTTGDLAARAMQSADLAGNFYAWRQGNRLRAMRPDWVTIVLGSDSDPDAPADALDAEIAGYLYHPGGRASGKKPVPLLPETVCHYAPTPDPVARFRGMSWLTPVIREVMADAAATQHKLEFFENGATPNLAVKFDAAVRREAFQEWVQAFRDQHEGVANAYKTMFLGGGADVAVVGANMRQIDFKTTQGAGETRIAAAAGVPPIIVGLSEGLQSATYSNYGLAMRRFTDLTIRPLWRNFAASLGSVVNVPVGSELWYDDRDIPALGEDGKSRADIDAVQASTIHTLITAGFDPDSAIDAVNSGDFTKLSHTGLYSVQLQPAGKVGEGKGALVEGVPVGAAPAAPAAAGNGAAVPTTT